MKISVVLILVGLMLLVGCAGQYQAPPAEQGHLLLWTEKKYDVGIDDVLSRMHPTWFCEQCLPKIKIDESFR